MAKNSYQGYWAVFGGAGSLLRSSYFWLSLVLAIISHPLWANKNGEAPEWSSLATGIIPNLLGFSLGGMAIMLSFSSGRFLEAVRQSGKEDSYFMKMMASFFHFSVVLATTLILAIVTKFVRIYVLDFIGVLLLFYGITLVPATAASIWHTARIFNAAIEPPDKSKE